MWACCADSSSDEDEHNTGHTLSLLFTDVHTAPSLLSDLSELGELTVALLCRFALDNFTVAQQDRPPPEPDLLAHGPEPDLLALSRRHSQAFGRQDAWTCILVAFLLLPAGLLKVPLSLNDPGGGSLVLLRALVGT